MFSCIVGRWEHIHDGIVRDNCFNNTETLGPFLKLMGLETDIPLYVASYWSDVDPALNSTVMQSLRDEGYLVGWVGWRWRPMHV
jgi:hypothetical protein